MAGQDREAGARRRAEHTYQQLDVLRLLRQEESRVKLLNQRGLLIRRPLFSSEYRTPTIWRCSAFHLRLEAKVERI